MSDDWIEDQALRFEGFDDAEIAQIKAAIPVAQQLIALVQKNETDLTHMVMLVKSILPVANLVATKLKERMT
jgi:hypothetical protein